MHPPDLPLQCCRLMWCTSYHCSNMCIKHWDHSKHIIYRVQRLIACYAKAIGKRRLDAAIQRTTILPITVMLLTGNVISLPWKKPSATLLDRGYAHCASPDGKACLEKTIGNTASTQLQQALQMISWTLSCYMDTSWFPGACCHLIEWLLTNNTMTLWFSGYGKGKRSGKYCSSKRVMIENYATETLGSNRAYCLRNVLSPPKQ